MDRKTEVRFLAVAGDFSPCHRVHVGLGLLQPRIHCVTGSFSQVIKRPGREADHSSSSFAEVKNSWSYTAAPQ
jgi:hypothetical protein